MKKLLLGGMLIGLLSGISLTQDSTPSPFANLQKILDDEIKATQKPEAEFEAMYLKHLGNLENETRVAGDLEKLLKVKEEIKDFRDSKKRDYSDYPKLQKLRGIYESKIAEIRVKVFKEQRKMLESYLEKLAVLKKEKTFH